MSSRGDRPEVWDPNAEAAAPAGRTTPEVDATGPLFDPLTSPLPDDGALIPAWERVEPRTRPPETSQYGRSVEERPAPPARRPQPERSAGRSNKRRPRSPLRRVKRTLRHIDPVSVLKVSLIYYACLLVIWLLIVALIFSFLKSLGLFDQIEEIRAGLVVGKEKFEITLGLVEKWAFLIGITLTILGALVNVFLAFLYNAISDAVGGIEMTFVERDV